MAAPLLLLACSGGAGPDGGADVVAADGSDIVAPDGAEAGGDDAVDVPRPPMCAPDASLPGAPERGPVPTMFTQAVLTREASPPDAPPPLAVLTDAREPASPAAAPLHVAVPNAQCSRVMHLVNPLVAIPTNGNVRILEASFRGAPLRMLESGESYIVEWPYSYGEQRSFFRPLFSLEGVPAGAGDLVINAYDAAHTLVTTATVPGLTVVPPPPPLAGCQFADAPHPRIFLTPARLARIRARDRATDPAARRYYGTTTGVDYFLAALATHPDPTTAEFADAVYNPESYIPALGLCYQLARGTDDARADTCAAAALRLTDRLAADYDTGVRTFDRDTGYDIRLGLLQLMLAYDWLHPRLSAAQRALYVSVATRWIDWYRAHGYAESLPWNNYFASYLEALTLTAVATAGDATPAQTDAIVGILNEKLYWNAPLLNQRACGGDWPEGWNYAADSLRSYALTRAVLRDFGADWPVVFDWLDHTPRWMTYQMSPDFTELRSFGGYSGSRAHFTSPSLLAVLSSTTSEGALAARLYTTGLATSGNDLEDDTPAFTAYEMIFADTSGAPADVSGLSRFYLASGTGRFFSRSSLTAPDAYQVAGEDMAYFYDHYGYASGDVRLYHGATCLLCPRNYRGPSFRGEEGTTGSSTFLVNGMDQDWGNWNNQVLYTAEGGALYNAVAMRFESSYAPGDYEDGVISADMPLDYLVREAVHVMPGTLVVRDQLRTRHDADAVSALFHLGGAASTVTTVAPGQYRVGTLRVSTFGAPAAVFTADTDDGGTAIGTQMRVNLPRATSGLEVVSVFSEADTGASYAAGTLRLSSGACVVFNPAPARVMASCP